MIAPIGQARISLELLFLHLVAARPVYLNSNRLPLIAGSHEL